MKSDGSSCTTFVFDVKTYGSAAALPLAKNMSTKMKSLRFPGIIKFLEAQEVRSTNKAEQCSF
jgi:hypothetical protein